MTTTLTRAFAACLFAAFLAGSLAPRFASTHAGGDGTMTKSKPARRTFRAGTRVADEHGTGIAPAAPTSLP